MEFFGYAILFFVLKLHYIALAVEKSIDAGQQKMPTMNFGSLGSVLGEFGWQGVMSSLGRGLTRTVNIPDMGTGQGVRRPHARHTGNRY